MKFHALLPVRDEADILEQCLRHLLTWADAVYVFDTGSCDDTWELVCAQAANDRRIVPLAQDPVFFSEKRVRAWLFHQARRHMRDGDWFARVDADEFHHLNPRDFVKTRMRRHETVAYHQYYDFHLTSSEVEDWRAGRETLADRKRPITERRRWFTISSYTEPRLCRYRESMQWPESVSFPYNAGYLAVERLPIRHYPHRDPVQLNRRCRLRTLMMTEPDNACVSHWATTDWVHHVKSTNAPGIHYWTPGTLLPDAHFTNHLATAPTRAFQRICHGFCLPILDWFRTGYFDASYPHRLPKTFQDQLRVDLRPDNQFKMSSVHH